MKLNWIFCTLTVAAGMLCATACGDSDTPDETPVVPPTPAVSVSASMGSDVVLYGEKVITVKFDQSVSFASKNASRITLNGEPVKRAAMLDVSTGLTTTNASTDLVITAGLNFYQEQTLVIPAGLIGVGQGKTYDKDITLTWTAEGLPDNEATAMTKKLGWGWNLGNHFDTGIETIMNGWGYWDGVTQMTAEPFRRLAAAGAKTVRIPVTWTAHTNDENVISETFFDEVAGVVDMAIGAGLNVVLNCHHESFATDLGRAATNAAQARKDSALIVGVWKQVATRFANYGDQLLFETFNEVRAGDKWNNATKGEYALLNQWNQMAVDVIRSTGGNNATRWIGVAGYAANIDMTINHLVIPTDAAKRLMVAVHCYDPYAFCLQPINDDGTVAVNSWGRDADPAMSVAGANEEYIIAQLYKLRTAYIEKGIPCYMGEYGCVNQTTESANAFRKYYLEYFCRSARLAGVPLMLWDNNSKGKGNEACGYVDHATGNWIGDSGTLVPMMIQSLSE